VSKKATVRLIKYGSCALLVAIYAVGHALSNQIETLKPVDQYRILCDAFTVPGMLLLMFGLMSWLASQGAMDGILFCMKALGRYLIPGRRLEERETYGDFVVQRREKKHGGYGFLLISGLVTMAVSTVFLILYYSVYQ
jgi:hypothetical protein